MKKGTYTEAEKAFLRANFNRMTYRQMAEWLERTERSVQRQSVRLGMRRKEQRKRKVGETLCWSCARAAGAGGVCPWAARLKPVPGWEAQPTKIYENGAAEDSYCVLDCPLYLEEDREKRGEKI